MQAKSIVFVLVTAVLVVLWFMVGGQSDTASAGNPSLEPGQPPAESPSALAASTANPDKVDLSTRGSEFPKSIPPDSPAKLGYEEGEVLSSWGDFVPMRKVYENCKDVQQPVVQEGGGIVYVDTEECETNVYVDHAYGDLPTTALRELAKSDGAAALILGDRLQRTLPGRPEIVQRLYVHAFALSAEPQAFDALVDYQDATLSYENGQLAVDDTVRGWIWARIGQELGLRDQKDVQWFADALADVGIKDMSEPAKEVETWLADLDERRLAATGSAFR